MADTRKIRVLLFSTLYPSSVRPGHGIFVETRLRELLSSGQVEVKVVAPVPWFFSGNPRFGEYALMARTPHRELRHGVDVLHPRYLLPPKVGMSVAPFSLAAGSMRTIQGLIDEGFDFDLIDAHYYYPDGVAAALLARRFVRPFVVTARGTDINFIPRYFIPRKLIQKTARSASMSIAVCAALKDELRSLGVDEERLLVLRNGVDLRRFRPVEQREARIQLGLKDAPTLLSVGYLNERKGHHLVINVLRNLPGFRLVIVGSGPDRSGLGALASQLGVKGRVTFVGSVPQEELYRYYSAADILVLASSREGWANVLLESMACGTPVVATNVWGTPEIISSPTMGRLARERSSDAIAEAVSSLMQAYPERASVRRCAEQFDWSETTEGQLALFRRVIDESERGKGARISSVAARRHAAGTAQSASDLADSPVDRGLR